jgi:adenylosuccinate lyase
MRAWDEEQDFRSLVEADAEIGAALDGDALAEAFDVSVYTRHVDAVFERLRALSRKEEPIHA